MTLKQVFTAWSLIPENIVLSAKYRDAVNKVLMKKYADTDIKTITKRMAQDILSQSSERQELKSKAASVIMSLLEYGSEKGYCNKPCFGFEALTTTKKNTEIPAVIENADLDTSHNESVIKTDAISPKENIESEQKAETMEKKKTSGKQPKKVCQLDPETLKVVNTYESISAGCRAVGVKNLERAIRKHQRGGGFYWAYPEDVENFRPAEKHPSGNMKGKGSEDEFHVAMRPLRSAKTKILQFQDSQPENESILLSSASNEELVEEMRRRGWKGSIEITVTVEL